MRRNDPTRPGQPPLGLAGAGLSPNLYDLAIFILIAAAFVILAHGARQIAAPGRAAGRPADRRSIRGTCPNMRCARRCACSRRSSPRWSSPSSVATLAAKSRKAELVIMPALDILQSVPVLGFLTFTVTFFLRLFPGSELGAECAAIFAIFTSQAWNMAFSFYQSLRTVPRDLDEVSRAFPALAVADASGGSRRRSPRPA